MAIEVYLWTRKNLAFIYGGTSIARVFLPVILQHILLHFYQSKSNWSIDQGPEKAMLTTILSL